VNGLPCASVPVVVNENGWRDGAAEGEGAPLDDGMNVP